MNELNDEQLDLLLRDHFSTELDGQLGRAPVAILARSRRRSPWRAAVNWGVGGGFALAAAIGALFLFAPLLKIMSRGGDSDSHQVAQRAGAPVTPISEPVEHEIAWNTIDQGTVFVNDNVPMRSIRRQRVDSLKWIDPDTKAQMEVTVPHDEVVLVGLNAN